MKVTANTTYGGCKADDTKNRPARDGFALSLTTEVPDGTPEMVVDTFRHGLASLAYRGGASLLNDVLGVEKNTEVEFNDEDADKVSATLVKWFANACPNKKGTDTAVSKGFVVDVHVGRYTPGDDSATSRKMATSFVDQALSGPAAASLNTMLGLPATADYAAQVEAAHAKFFAKKK